MPQHCQAVYCHLTHLSSASLLKMVVTQLGETPRRGKERLYRIPKRRSLEDVFEEGVWQVIEVLRTGTSQTTEVG
jgi:hypothetical protein